VEVRAGPDLIDSGATSLFMSQGYVEHHILTTWKLQYPIAVYNVDAILCMNGHSKRTNFAVTNIGKQNLILGFT